MNKVVKRLLIGLAVVAGLLVFVAVVAFAVVGPAKDTPLRYVIPALVASIGGAYASGFFIRRIRRRNSAIAAEHPDASVFPIFPFQPVRDAVVAIAEASGVPQPSPRYGTARPLVLVEDGTIALRMNVGAPALVEFPISAVTAMTTRELKVGYNRFPTIDLAIRIGDRDIVLPLPPTKPGAPTAKPTRQEFDAVVASFRDAISPV